VLVLISPLGLAYLGGDGVLVWQDREISVRDYATQLRAFIPAGSNVLGEAVWWFEFHDGRFVSDLTLTNAWPSLKDPKSPTEWVHELLTKRGVEYVLLDGHLGSEWQGPTPSNEMILYPIYERMVMTECQYVGEVNLLLYGVERNGPAFNQTTVWRCH
jgi:hypothetical protein